LHVKLPFLFNLPLLSNAQKIITKFEPVCCGQKHYLINFGDMLKGTSCTEEAPENVKENQGALLQSPNSFLVCLLWSQNNQGAFLQKSIFLLGLPFMTSDPVNKFLIIGYCAEIRIYIFFWQINDQNSRRKLMNVRNQTWSTFYGS
jgi:hypothetical protein